MRLDDEPRLRVLFLSGHDFGKLRIVVSSLEPSIPFGLGRVPPYVDERVLSTDAEFGVTFLRNPIAHVCDSMLRVNCSRSACKAGRERVSLSGLSRVDAQLVEPDSLLLLRESPTDAGHSERQSDERENLPFQHFDSPFGIDIQRA